MLLGYRIVLHMISCIAMKRSSHLLHLPRTGSYLLTPAQNQGTIILHGTKKSLPPLQYTCSCQPYCRQLRMSTQPQQQTGVTLSPHYRQENTSLQDQTMSPGLLHPMGYEPTQHVHYIVIDEQDNTCYMYGSLPSVHTPTDFV